LSNKSQVQGRQNIYLLDVVSMICNEKNFNSNCSKVSPVPLLFLYFDLHSFLLLQVQIRRLPKPVIAMVLSLFTPNLNFLCTKPSTAANYLLTLTQVAGYAVGGGHILHMVCDLTIAADNAIFGQTGPKVLQ